MLYRGKALRNPLAYIISCAAPKACHAVRLASLHQHLKSACSALCSRSRVAQSQFQRSAQKIAQNQRDMNSTAKGKWRRRRDSNPRDPSGPAPLAGVCLRPLGHVSADPYICGPRDRQAVFSVLQHMLRHWFQHLYQRHWQDRSSGSNCFGRMACRADIAQREPDSSRPLT